MHSGSKLASDPNFATLATSEEYARYFGLLERVFRLLLGCYRLQSGPDPAPPNLEAQLVAESLARLLGSVTSLHMKYAFTGEGDRRLVIDLTQSGFPNFTELAALERDMLRRDELMRDLPPTALLKRALLDHLIGALSEPELVLRELAQRTYLERLTVAGTFTPFVQGRLMLRGIVKGVRSYLFSFACYDFQTNRPYVHLMTFDYDDSNDPLEKSESQWRRFIEVIRAEGSRAPDVGVLALAIDDALEFVHPKIVKRVCVGPLYSPILFAFRPDCGTDERETILRKLLPSRGAREDDFMLFVTDEIIFSKRQEVSRSLFSPQGKVREVFAIQETDLECYARRASVINRYVLMTHHLLQHLSRSDQAEISGFESAKRFTVDEAENIHGI